MIVLQPQKKYRIILQKCSIFQKFILPLYSNQIQTLNLRAMTTQENVIKVIENSYKTKIESLSNSKDIKKVLVSKVCYGSF